MQGIKAPINKHSKLDLDDGTNPHGTNKSDVGLSNTDNTSDVDKPISTATQSALDAKISADGSINTHSDVDTSTTAPIGGDLLRWDGSSNEWKPSTSVVSTTYTYRKSFVAERNAAVVGKLALGNGSSINTMGVVITEDCKLVSVGISSSGVTSGQWQIFRNGTSIHTTNTTNQIVTVDELSSPVNLSSGDYINADCSNAGGAEHTVTFEVEITKTITGLKGDKGDAGSFQDVLKLTNTLVTNINGTNVVFSGFNTSSLINDFGANITIATNSITFNTDGRFRCDFNFYVTSVAPRTNVLFRWALNGVQQRGRSAQNYIRGSFGHNESSSCLSEILEVNIGDVLTIVCNRAANAGTVNVPAGESIFQLESLT
jgi:hypothetical protein